jgi:hypothetical protein
MLQYQLENKGVIISEVEHRELSNEELNLLWDRGIRIIDEEVKDNLTYFINDQRLQSQPTQELVSEALSSFMEEVNPDTFKKGDVIVDIFPTQLFIKLGVGKGLHICLDYSDFNTVKEIVKRIKENVVEDYSIYN